MNAQPTGRNLDDGFAVGIMSDLDSGDAQGKDYNHSGELHHATSKISKEQGSGFILFKWMRYLG